MSFRLARDDAETLAPHPPDPDGLVALDRPAQIADRSGDLFDPQAAQRAKAERAADTIRARFGDAAILKGRSLR